MKKLSIILFISILISSPVLAQRKLKQLDEEEAQKKEKFEDTKTNKLFDAERWSFGGNLGGNFYNNVAAFNIQPIAGYHITEKTTVGAGFTYIYYKYASYPASTVYGPIVFGRYQVLPSVFAHTEYQPLNYTPYDALGNTFPRQWQNHLYVGGGYGARKGGYIIVLYDVLYSAGQSGYYDYNLLPGWVLRFGIFF